MRLMRYPSATCCAAAPCWCDCCSACCAGAGVMSPCEPPLCALATLPVGAASLPLRFGARAGSSKAAWLAWPFGSAWLAVPPCEGAVCAPSACSPHCWVATPAVLLLLAAYSGEGMCSRDMLDDFIVMPRACAHSSAVRARQQLGAVPACVTAEMWCCHSWDAWQCSAKNKGCQSIFEHAL